VRQTPEWQQANPAAVERMLGWARTAQMLGADDPDRARGAALQLEAREKHDTWARLAQLDVPVLLCAGRFDGIAPLANMQAMAERIPAAELRIYEGGHLFLLQDRRAYGDIVAWFGRANAAKCPLRLHIRGSGATSRLSGRFGVCLRL
jgi:3-oxoadipate enol-lactonase